MQNYRIIVNSSSESKFRNSYIINCSYSINILTAMLMSGIIAPYSCRTGTCSTCVALVEKGSFVQDDQNFLSEDQVQSGYILTCVAIPISDANIILDKEMDLYQ